LPPTPGSCWQQDAHVSPKTPMQPWIFGRCQIGESLRECKDPGRLGRALALEYPSAGLTCDWSAEYQGSRFSRKTTLGKCGTNAGVGGGDLESVLATPGAALASLHEGASCVAWIEPSPTQSRQSTSVNWVASIPHRCTK
jgi:hypothetical protein